MPDHKKITSTPKSWATDRAVMNKAVRAAGAVVLERYKAGEKGWQKKDKSPVSEADHIANTILRQHLIEDHAPHYGFLSEESADNPARLEAKRVWVIDPIDGTRAFLNGKPHFTVCAALIEDGYAIASAVFNPATDEFFEAGLGEGAKLNGAPIAASSCSGLTNCKIIGHQQMFAHPAWPQKWPEMQIGARNSTNYRMALVAAGEFDACMALVPKADWDSAPGALIAQEAGAIVTDHLGRPFRYNQPKPQQASLVCAAATLYADLQERVAHLPETIPRQGGSQH